MAATSDDIVNLLRQRRIIASSQIVDSLREHSDPAKLLDLGYQIDFHRGVLTQEIFEKLTALSPQDNQKGNLTSTSKITSRDVPHAPWMILDKSGGFRKSTFLTPNPLKR